MLFSVHYRWSYLHVSMIWLSMKVTGCHESEMVMIMSYDCYEIHSVNE